MKILTAVIALVALILGVVVTFTTASGPVLLMFVGFAAVALILLSINPTKVQAGSDAA